MTIPRSASPGRSARAAACRTPSCSRFPGLRDGRPGLAPRPALEALDRPRRRARGAAARRLGRGDQPRADPPPGIGRGARGGRAAAGGARAGGGGAGHRHDARGGAGGDTERLRGDAGARPPARDGRLPRAARLRRPPRAGGGAAPAAGRGAPDGAQGGLRPRPLRRHQHVPRRGARLPARAGDPGRGADRAAGVAGGGVAGAPARRDRRRPGADGAEVLLQLPHPLLRVAQLSDHPRLR